MTKSLHRHCTFKTVLERKRRRSGFSAEMQRHEEKVQKWFAVADCSRHEQRRPGRLDRRWWSRVRRIISDEDEAERSRCRASRSAGQQSLSMRYGSANPCRHLYTRTVSLKSIHSRTFSQWSWRRTGVTWSNFDNGKISRAAAFITDWSRWRRCAGMSTRVELLKSSQDKTSDDTSNWRTGLNSDWQMLRSWCSIAKQADIVFVTWVEWVRIKTSESV